jgi:hypothetical protein
LFEQLSSMTFLPLNIVDYYYRIQTQQQPLNVITLGQSGTDYCKQIITITKLANEYLFKVLY